MQSCLQWVLTCFSLNDCMMLIPPSEDDLIYCSCFRCIEVTVCRITSSGDMCGEDKLSATFSITWLLFFSVLADALELPVCG